MNAKNEWNRASVFWFNKISLLCSCTYVNVLKREKNNHNNWNPPPLQQQQQQHKHTQKSNFSISMRIIYKSNRPITDKQTNKRQHTFTTFTHTRWLTHKRGERETKTLPITKTSKTDCWHSTWLSDGLWNHLPSPMCVPLSYFILQKLNCWTCSLIF